MSVLEESLMNMVRTSRLWQEGGTVIAACSGGADSLTLTDIMAKAAEEDDVTVLVAHVHHHLRGEEADEDARFVSAFCKDRDLSYTQFDIDPQALKEKEGLSLEDAARRLRYEALETYRKKVGAQGIFVAHHEDDQAETILMNLVRGTGTRGLRGMLPVNGYIARPFLAATRKDMETYCKEEGLSYRTDSTNGNPALLRNWVRLELLPLLATKNPRIKAALVQAAAVAKSDEAYLEKMAQKYLDSFSRNIFGTYDIDVGPTFDKLDLAIKSRVIRLAVKGVGGEELGFDHVKKILRLIEKGISGKSLDVPGHVRLIYINGRLMAGRHETDRAAQREKKLEIKEKQRHASQY